MTDHGAYYWIRHAFFRRYARAEVPCKHDAQWQCSRVTLYTAGHLHTAVPHCSHSRAPIVHTAVLRENNEHGCVYLRCRAVCKLPGCVEGHPWCFRVSTNFLHADSKILFEFANFAYIVAIKNIKIFISKVWG